jgi:hypothetical protein
VSRRLVGILALLFAAAHLPHLPSTLEDIDSVNFALGLRDFDVAEHRPHPPGYPIYIGVGKLAVLLSAPLHAGAEQSTIEARSLAALSLLGATAAVVLLYRLMSTLSFRGGASSAAPWHAVDVRALTATTLAACCPLLWYAAVRPMSDAPGLAAALAAQVCLALAWWRQQPGFDGDRRLSPGLLEASGRMIVLGALLSGLAIGWRAQNAMLTVPLLLIVLIDRIGRGFGAALVGASVAFAVGIVCWFVPLVVASGGLDAYLAALGSQAGEDFAGVEMLYLDLWNVRLGAYALLRTFVYPWDSIWLASCVLLLAAAGGVKLLIDERRTLLAVAAIGIPYLVFHLLFQDTTFTRYALPLVPAVAFLAACGAQFVARGGAVVVVGALVVWALVIATPVITIYGNEASPTVRAVHAVNEAAASAQPGALAMHQTFRRPLAAERVLVDHVLPSPPRREWLELARYWREGNTAPLWFLADPRRTDLALIDPRSHDSPREFRWDFDPLSQLGGMRPAAAAWHQIVRPGWFAEEGWALTPETAGIARLMGRGPHLGPITAHVRRRAEAAVALVGGRHLGGPDDPPVRFEMRVDGRPIAQWDSAPGFFVREIELPAGALSGEGALAVLTLQSRPVSGSAAIASAIEQFDLQSRGVLMWAFDTGWNEAEYTPALGIWRWTSDRSTLRVLDASAPVTVSFRVEAPRRYYDDDVTLRVMAGSVAVSEATFGDDKSVAVTVPADVLRAAGGRLTLETNRTFVPASLANAPDKRVLGLRIFDVRVRATP